MPKIRTVREYCSHGSANTKMHKKIPFSISLNSIAHNQSVAIVMTTKTDTLYVRLNYSFIISHSVPGLVIAQDIKSSYRDRKDVQICLL